MGIQLYFSNRLAQLADRYAAIIDLENRGKEVIFEGPLTIVPNPNLKKWLHLTLAQKQSISMNLDFQYLESGLWGVLTRLDPGDEAPEMIDTAFLQMLLLYELKNLKKDDPEFAPLSRYLCGSEGEKGPGYTLKLWQLSEKMAHLFQDYEFHRSEMLKRWRYGRDKLEGMELCQQKLYLRLMELRDRYSQSNKKNLLSMSEYADEVFSKARPELMRAGKKTFIHLFGLSQVSAFHLGLIGRLRDYFEVFIYALNPCREFWEDIKTPQEKKWIQRKKVKKLEIKPEEKDLGELSDQDDNELLALWGKPGRESIRLLCQLTDYNFYACFEKETEGSSVLRRIQNGILTLSGEKDTNKKIPQDKSLQIAACPDIYREVETVRNSILYNLQNDSTLQLTDIAILVPDISCYKPVFDSVFNRNPKCLSYNLVDSRADIESIYGKALLGILDLAGGRFSRKEVFDLILNPCFMKKWNIGPEEIRVWVGWAESLNIFHTFDRESKKSKGYQESSYYTWQQGLQRVRLSRIMSAPGEGSADNLRHFNELIPFFDVNTGDVDLMEKFSLIVEKLAHVTGDLTSRYVSGEEWGKKFLKICDDLLEIPPDLKGETAVHHALFEAFENLKVYDRLIENLSGEDREKSKIDADLIKEFIKSNLSSISGGYGDYLTGGVTISSLLPMRPIPFRIVYVLGMEEGVFPGKAETSSLDLRLLKRHIGDINLPERNRYLFLEMLLCVRDKLYICYISRDLQKDRILQPCSVVNQLRRYIEQEILADGLPFNVTDIPLKGSSEKYLIHDAVNDLSDVLINYSLADRIAFFRENHLWEQIKKKVPKDRSGDIERFSPDFSVEIEMVEKDERLIEKITLKQLKKFLEDPVTQSVRRHLGLYDEEETIEEIILSEDEPFYSEFPADYQLKTNPLKQWLDYYASPGTTKAGKLGPEEIYDHFYDNSRLKSSTPEGAFGELDKNVLREDVSTRAGTLSAVLEQIQPDDTVYRAIFVGEQADEYIPSFNELPIERFDPITLEVKTVNSRGAEVERALEIHGQLPWVWKDREGGWHALVLTGAKNAPSKPRSKPDPDKYVLEPVLFYLCCILSKQGSRLFGSSAMTFHVVYREETRTWSYAFRSEEAAQYLTNLVSDYLNQENVNWLPFYTNKQKRERIYSESVNDLNASEDKKEKFRAGLEDSFRENEDSYLVRLVSPRIPPDAFDKVRERFKLFFDTI